MSLFPLILCFTKFDFFKPPGAVVSGNVFLFFFFPGSQISPPLPSLVPHGGQLARNACTVLEYDCPVVTFGAMSGTLRYNCSSQQWSAIDLTSCSGALHANSIACNEL